MTPKDFRALSTFVRFVVPHDELTLTLWASEKCRAPLVLASGNTVRDLPIDLRPPTEKEVARLTNEADSVNYGFASGIQIPVRVTNGLTGFLTLLSREPGVYGEDALLKSKALADYVCEALSQEDLVERLFDDLLETLSGVLDIREVFPRVSVVIANAIPHDRLTLTFIDENDRLAFVASSNEDQPSVEGLLLKVSDLDQAVANGYKLIGDLEREISSFVDPADFRNGLLKAGYRSFLVPHISTQFHALGLGFWSKRPDAFNVWDLPLARRLAEFVGMVLSHQQLSEAARITTEERAKAERLERRVEALTDELNSKTGYNRLVGQSAAWKGVLKRATQVAGTETTVLLIGDSGTGKEVIARFIHRASTRKDGPLVALNCAALPEQLLESELFGYERGAFTSAHQAKRGQVELAAGGVLFLDEVIEMSRSAQAKLLRLLQEREFQRLGGTRIQKADIRVIAATNGDLKKAVANGTFREDLYYRLSVFDIQLPRLRDRTDDILLFAEAFLGDFAKSFARPPAGLTRRAKDALLTYKWPGNVRELRNVLERAAILSDGGLIDLDHLSLETTFEEPPTIAPTDLSVVEQETIQRVMRESKGNKSKAAKLLGLTRMQLYGRLEKYGIGS